LLSAIAFAQRSNNAVQRPSARGRHDSVTTACGDRLFLGEDRAELDALHVGEIELAHRGV
jgi:hypothetical protein